MPFWLWFTLAAVAGGGTGVAVSHFTRRNGNGAGAGNGNGNGNGNGVDPDVIFTAAVQSVDDPSRDFAGMISRNYAQNFNLCSQQFPGDLQGIVLCMANGIFPGYAWPPPPGPHGQGYAPGWQKNAWSILGDRVRASLGLPPRPVG
jgi:hypothetical protein